MPVDAGLKAYIRIHGSGVPPTEAQSFQEIIIGSHDRYSELIRNRGNLGVPTGIREFDADSGGLKDGQMTVIAGETNAGKSTVAINFAVTALKANMGVALFSLEMDREEIADMIVSMVCGVNRNAFNTGYFSDTDMQAITSHTKALSEFPLYIEDAPMMNVAQIRQRVTELKTEDKIRLVIIDYAQIVSPNDQRDPREQQVARIARELRSMAKELKLPFLVLSQLNDEGKLRESRVLAHEAHNVFQVEPTDEGLRLRIYKGRRIPKKSYDLKWEPQYCRISSPVKPEETNPDWARRTEQ